MQSTAALIVNGKSRRGREWYELAKKVLQDTGFDLKIAELVREPKHIDRLIKQAIAEGIPLVCVGGGDGTLSMVASHFIGSQSVLGILPLGTGNSLARDLGIPPNVQEAARIIAEGAPKSIDLGEVNGRIFVNVATIGLSTRIAENLESGAKKRFGRFVYVGAILRALTTMKPFRITLRVNGEDREFKSVQTVIGSGRYHAGPFPILPDAGIRTGKLAGYVVIGNDRSALWRYAWRLLWGRHEELPEVYSFEAESLSVKTAPPRRITVDGEIKMQTPAEFRCLPLAIKVMLPKGADLDPGTA